MKIIFLDIDGVLAIGEENGEWGLNRELQIRLGKILKETGAKLVISSSWRYSTVEKTKESFKEKGFMYVEDIIGVTSRKITLTNTSTDVPRGLQIHAWIEDNFEYKERDRVRYLILDDDADMMYWQRNNFIKTNSFEGLSEKDVISAINILNGE